MAELGQLLRETRESKGLSLSDVEKATRIRASYLEALEQEDYARLPGDVYTRGFLRNYARFLGLIPEDVLASFDPARSVRAKTPSPDSQLDLDIPISVPLKPVSRRVAGWIILVVLLGVVLGLGGWWAYRTYLLPSGFRLIPPQWLTLAAPTATATATPTSTPSPLPTATLVSEGPIPVQTVTATIKVASPTVTASATMTETSTPTPRDTSTPTYTARPTDTPTVTMTPTPKVYAGVELRIEITDVSWVRVAVDGIQVFEGELEVGETRVWEGTRSVSLRVGNAGGVLVTLNGDLIGALGAVGEVVDQEWIMEGAVLSTSTPGPSPTSEPTTESTAESTVEPTPEQSQEPSTATATPGVASG